MRLLIISFITLVFVFMLLGITRFWGLGHHERTFSSKFWQTAQINSANSSSDVNNSNTAVANSTPREFEIIVPWEQSFFLEKRPHLVLWAKAYLNDKNTVLVMPSFENFTTVKRELGQSEARPALEELLKEFPNTRFLIEFNDNKTEVDKMLFTVVENAKAQERVIIQSNYNIILESTKKLLPLALFGTGTADIMRFGVFESLFILPSVPFKGDVFIFGLHKNGISLSQVSEAWVKEMKRRDKKVILAISGQDSEILLAKSLAVDGLILQKPELVIK